MRRPNRAIEVFDISLMAVVTKAMGAFLVLMVVFMQYYSSGPLGRKTAADIAQSIEDTQSDMTEAMKKLVERANPDEIAKLLEEARRRLDEAKRLIEQLRRENDALNSQVERLESENKRLEKQIEELQRKIETNKIVVSGNLINWDCMDTRLRLAVVQDGMYIIREKENAREKYVLNYGVTLGAGDSNDDDDFKTVNPTSTIAPGTGVRFNNSSFRYAADPGTLGLIVVKQNTRQQKIGNYEGRALRQSQQDCSVYVSLQAAVPGEGRFATNLTTKFIVPKEAYAFALYDLRLGGNGLFNTQTVSQATNTWLADQIAHAVKVSP